MPLIFYLGRQNGGKNTAKFESRFGKIGVSGRFDLGFGRGCWSVRKNDGKMVEEVRKIDGKTTERLIVISDKRGFPGL